jgi:parvulin-like peptidyl-prolyl isomerase
MNPNIVDISKRRARHRRLQILRLARRGWLFSLASILVLVLVACASRAQPTRTSRPMATQPTLTAPTVAASQEAIAPPPTADLPPTSTPAPTPTPPAPLAAQVNGEYIFLADYEQRVQQYEQALLDQGVDPDTAEGQELLGESRRDVLEGMIDSVLIEQGGAALGVALSDEELEAQLAADIDAGGGQAAFDEWLQGTGQTRDDYKEMLRQSLLAQRVMEAVTAGVSAEAEQVHARHIVVDTEEEAEGILAALEGGADFVALARQHSVDTATKDNGGDLGWFPRGLVAPELENAAFALQPGQVSEPIQLGEGYHIVQVVEREAARPLSLETQMDVQRAMFEQWLDELRAAAQIERYVQD